MEIKEYIASGILELYVMGALTKDEEAEVEKLARIHPEVQQEIILIGETLSQSFLNNPVIPPAHIKGKVMDEIAKNNPHTVAMDSEITSSPEPPIYIPSRKTANMKFYAYAASILLMVSLGLNFYFFNESSEKDQQLGLAVKQIDSLKGDYAKVYNAYYELESKLSMIVQPQHTMVKMVQENKEDLAIVIWDTKTRKVYVAVEKLTDLPKGMQYQLWAIVDGKTVDLGVFDPMKKFDMKEMKQIDKASAFAITIEKAGGSPEPHLENMVVMGNV